MRLDDLKRRRRVSFAAYPPPELFDEILLVILLLLHAVLPLGSHFGVDDVNQRVDPAGALGEISLRVCEQAGQALRVALKEGLARPREAGQHAVHQKVRSRLPSLASALRGRGCRLH
eukprot:1187336-Prorocentrum_minimum.AAC.15